MGYGYGLLGEQAPDLVITGILVVVVFCSPCRQHHHHLHEYVYVPTT